NINSRHPVSSKPYIQHTWHLRQRSSCQPIERKETGELCQSCGRQ
ncbi:unnamed protein product, partial [Musa acuminata subsp. burmannicoides]